MLIGVATTVAIAGVMLVITKFGFGGESDYEQQIARQKEVLLSDDSKSKGVDKKKQKADKKKSKGWH